MPLGQRARGTSTLAPLTAAERRVTVRTRRPTAAELEDFGATGESADSVICQIATMTASTIPTVWVLGDQLDRTRGALAGRMPGECRVLLVESQGLIMSRRWHRQRLHLVLSAMEHFAVELTAEGFDVDHRRASSLRQGLRDHIAEVGARSVIAMEPMSWNGPPDAGGSGCPVGAKRPVPVSL